MFNKVMWATDGSDAADRAVPYVKDLAGQGGGELVVVHVEEMMPPAKAVGGFLNPDEDSVEDKIKRQVAELSADGLRVTQQTMVTQAGGAAHSIAEAARKAGVDVIVVGTRGRTPLAGLLLGSTTQRLLHISPCPVLSVPSAHHPEGG